MDIGLHIQYFTHGMLDAVVWMRMVRILVFAISGFLMLREPMLCGGRNKVLHRLLSLQFFAAAFYSWGIAQSRMNVLVSDPTALVKADLLLFEVVYTITSGLLLTKLAYDLVKFNSYEKVRKQPSDCVECPRVFHTGSNRYDKTQSRDDLRFPSDP